MHIKLLGIIALFLFTSLSSAAQTQPPIRVKCEGPNYTDSKGQLWQADYGYNGGMLSNLSATIKGTADQALFLTARKNENGSASLIYSFNIPNGAYHVNLCFAETWGLAMAAGRRVFNVKMQGSPVFTKLDIFAEAGADATLIKGADITVANNWATIEFDNVVDVAKFYAIEILPGNSGPALSMNFQYPDGTPVAGNLTYTVSSSLLSFSGNAPLEHGQLRCALLANPSDGNQYAIHGYCHLNGQSRLCVVEFERGHDSLAGKFGCDSAIYTYLLSCRKCIGPRTATMFKYLVLEHSLYDDRNANILSH